MTALAGSKVSCFCLRKMEPMLRWKPGAYFWVMACPGCGGSTDPISPVFRTVEEAGRWDALR